MLAPKVLALSGPREGTDRIYFMSYYKVIGLTREPFSTSPDPDFLYRSRSHISALHRLEIAVRLRRGLSLILGDIGTGKTTIARSLIQSFMDEPEYVIHLVLDPHYKNRENFILELCRIFGIQSSLSGGPELIERYLFEKGVVENKTVVLIIDEGQILNSESLEVLRTLLNYETNEYKLLQLVIMAQLEFLETAGRIRNFMDRVAFKYVLNPLDEEEMREMIEYRLQQAGRYKKSSMFTDAAIREIYNYTKGYPRKVMNLCRQALETLVMYDKDNIDADIVKELIKQDVNVLQAHHVLFDMPPMQDAVKI